MPENLPDLAAALNALSKAGVRFVLVGGMAMTAHGSAYITVDIDVCYARDPENLSRLMGALAPLAPWLRGEDAPFILDARTFKNTFNLTLQTTIGDLDLLAEPVGVTFEGLWERALVMELYGVSTRVASLDDLIAIKRAAGRVKDQLHLLELEALRTLLAEDGV